MNEHYLWIVWYFHMSSVKFALSQWEPSLFLCLKSNFDTAPAVNIWVSFSKHAVRKFRSQSENPNTGCIHEGFLCSSKLARDDLTPGPRKSKLPTVRTVRNLTRLQRTFLKSTHVRKDNSLTVDALQSQADLNFGGRATPGASLLPGHDVVWYESTHC